MTAEAGREHPPVTMFGVPPDVDKLKHYRDIGVDRLVVSVDSAGAEKILPELDKWAGLVRAVGG